MSEQDNDNQDQQPDPEVPAEDSVADDDASTPADENGAFENLSLQDQLAAAIGERDANHEKWVRSQAEIDNVRKRSQRELQESREYQSLALISDLLPALDNLDRAIAAAGQSQNVDELLQGINMVQQQFRDILGGHAAQPIDAEGQPFDPSCHQAIQQVPSADHEPMTVLQVALQGWTMKERVVRPSQVIVSCAPPEEDASDDNETSESDE